MCDSDMDIGFMFLLLEREDFKTVLCTALKDKHLSVHKAIFLLLLSHLTNCIDKVRNQAFIKIRWMNMRHKVSISGNISIKSMDKRDLIFRGRPS